MTAFPPVNKKGTPRRGGRPPGARNKIEPDVRRLARGYTKEAIDALVDIMRHGETEAARVGAARDLLDRAWGKPAQAVTGADGGNIVVQIVKFSEEG